MYVKTCDGKMKMGENMEKSINIKIPVVLLMINSNMLNPTLQHIRIDRVDFRRIVVDDDANLNVSDGAGNSYRTSSFAAIESIIEEEQDAYWLLAGFNNRIREMGQMAKLLADSGVKREKIINFEVNYPFFLGWMKNLRYTENHPIDYFATGISYQEVGLDMSCIQGYTGVNLAASSQDLRQSYLTAKYVLEHQPKGQIKFVLIGLSPYAMDYDSRESFSTCTVDMMYKYTIVQEEEKSLKEQLVEFILDEGLKSIYSRIDDQDADITYEKRRRDFAQNFTAQSFLLAKEDAQDHVKNFDEKILMGNQDILRKYIELCLEYNVTPVGVIWPFASVLQRNYPKETIGMLRILIRQLQNQYEFPVVDLFDYKLGYDCFYNVAHLNMKGANAASTVLSKKMEELGIIRNELRPQDISYAQLYQKSLDLPKEEYQAFKKEILNKTVAKLRDKDKIKVGFVLYDASMWCGDELYNLFAIDERYDVAVYLCLRKDAANNAEVNKDFFKGEEQLIRKGINVKSIISDDVNVGKLDIAIYLTPYFSVLHKQFQLNNICMDTLIAYINYGYNVEDNSTLDYINMEIPVVAWRMFMESEDTLEDYQKYCRSGFYQGVYTGYPKMDEFYINKKSDFTWKSDCDKPFKIIYAPHWSINAGINISTFHYNCHFMYEFAKKHNNISWVFKPHPNLLFSAVTSGVFKTAEDFNAYLKKWDDLPNAQVITGGYYQDIFKSSDAMILDSCSFISEYQYVHKPMLFLDRNNISYNKYGLELIHGIYRVDGRDFYGIADFVENVIIRGNDIRKEKRDAVFAKYMDYKQRNGMLASEMIFKHINDIV